MTDTAECCLNSPTLKYQQQNPSLNLQNCNTTWGLVWRVKNQFFLPFIMILSNFTILHGTCRITGASPRRKQKQDVPDQHRIRDAKFFVINKRAGADVFQSLGRRDWKEIMLSSTPLDVLHFFSASLQKVMLREQMQPRQMSSNCPLHCYYWTISIGSLIFDGKQLFSPFCYTDPQYCITWNNSFLCFCDNVIG